MRKSSAIEIGLSPPPVVKAEMICPTSGAFTMSARPSPGGGGGMLSPENIPEILVSPPRLVIMRSPSRTIRGTRVRVDLVADATDLQTPLEKKRPTTPAATHVIKRGVS